MCSTEALGDFLLVLYAELLMELFLAVNTANVRSTSVST